MVRELNGKGRRRCSDAWCPFFLSVKPGLLGTLLYICVPSSKRGRSFISFAFILVFVNSSEGRMEVLPPFQSVTATVGMKGSRPSL